MKHQYKLVYYCQSGPFLNKGEKSIQPPHPDAIIAKMVGCATSHTPWVAILWAIPEEEEKKDPYRKS